MKNLAFIGCNHIFKKHKAAIDQVEGLRIIAVSDVDERVLNEQVEMLACEGFSDYREMIAKLGADIDYVVIATPSFLHYEQAQYALRHGCHVLLEKPPALTYTEFQNLLTVAKEHKRQLYSVLQLRYDPTFLIVARAIQAGLIGTVTATSLSVLFQRDRAYFDSWRSDVKKSGGILYDIAIHYLDFLLGAMGDEISSSVTKTYSHLNQAMYDTVHSIVDYKNGASGSIFVTAAAQPKTLGTNLTLLGTHGSIVLGGLQLNSIERVEFTSEANRAQWDKLVAEMKGANKQEQNAFTLMYRDLLLGHGVEIMSVAPVMRSLEIITNSI